MTLPKSDQFTPRTSGGFDREVRAQNISRNLKVAACNRVDTGIQLVGDTIFKHNELRVETRKRRGLGSEEEEGTRNDFLR